MLEDRTAPATLQLTLPNSISEGGAPGTATLTRTGDVSQVLRVNLSSSDTSEATVQTAVIFDNFVTQVSVPINAVDDALVDGTQSATITATADVVQGSQNFAPDLSFDGDGVALTELEASNGGPVQAMAVQQDGKIVVASPNDFFSATGWYLQRFNTDGTLDTSFGVNGLVETLDLGGGGPEPYMVFVQSDGKILVGGKVSTGVGAPILVRYNANGTLDSSFGVGGKANLAQLSTSWVSDIDVRPDGRILLGLEHNGSLPARVAQLNPNGTFDTTFGNSGPTANGVASIPLLTWGDQVELLPDGTFLVTSSITNPVRVAKVNANGTGLVTSFGSSGYASINFGSGSVRLAGMAVDSLGRISVAGNFTNAAGASDFIAARFLANGLADTSFSGGGSLILLTPGNELANSMVLQQDGKIVVGGWNRTGTTTVITDSAMARFNENGTPDATFDGDGYFQQSLVTTYTPDTITAMALQDDGKAVLLAGWSDDFRLFRFHMGRQLFTITASDTLDVLDNDTAVNRAPVAVNDAYTVGEDGVLVVSAPGPGTASGPVLRYGFDEASSGNATALDSGIYPPGNASLQLAATRTGNTPGGASRGALDLNSPVAAAYATAGDVNKVDGLPALTVTVWVNLQGAARDNQVILSDVPLNSDGANTGGWDLAFTTFNNVVSPVFSIHEKDSPGSSHASGKILTGLNLSNQWVFMAFTYTASQFLTTFNGSEFSAVTQNGGTAALGIPLRGNNAPLSIGRASNQTSTFASNPLAWIDDVRIYDRALTQAELEAVRQQGITPTRGVMTNDSDPNGDALTASVVTGPSNGSLTFFPDGNFHYVPNPNFNGTDSFTYRVSDGALQSAPATVTITVTPTNDAPVGAPDSYTTNEDTPLTVPAPGLLANDTDIDGDTLTFGRFVVPLQAGLGTVAVNPDGSFTYTPAPNVYSVGFGLPADSFSFAYTVTDGKLESAPIVVRLRVNPVNDPPVANDDSVTIAEDSGPVAIDVLANDSLQFDGDANKSESLAIVGFGQPAHGTVVQTGTQLTYTPNPNFFGTDSFNYAVTDSNGGGTDTATVTVTVTAVNEAPDAVDDSATTPDNAAVTIAVLGNDSDIDGGTLVVTGASDPLHGVTKVNADGTITYTPDGNFAGKDTFTYTVSDGQGGTDTATVEVRLLPRFIIEDVTVTEGNSGTVNADFTVRLSNSSPDTVSAFAVTADGTATAPGDYTARPPIQGIYGPGTISQIYRVTVQGDTIKEGNETFFVNLSSPTNAVIGDGQGVGTILDDDNAPPVASDDTASTAEDTAIVIDVLANDTDIENDTVTIAAVGTPNKGGTATISNGKITYTPAPNFNGTETFTYTVSDGKGGTDTATVTVNVTPVNDPPVAISFQYGTPEDTLLLDTLRTSDADGDELSYEIVTPPSQGTLVINNSSTGGFLYTPPLNFNGVVTFSFRVHDGAVSSNTVTSFITVAAVNDFPDAVNDAATIAEDSGAIAINVLGNDTDIDNDTLTIATVGTPTKGGTAVIDAGKITYTPAANFNGTETFTYSISDGKGGTDFATVTITVTPVNDAPVANDDALTIAEDSGEIFIAVLANDSDVDGDILAVTVLGVPDKGGRVLFNGNQIAYTPAPHFNGTETFAYTIGDGKGGTDTATVTVTVTPVNDAPDAVNDTATVAEDSGARLINVRSNDTDVDADTLTISAVGTPNKGGTAVVSNGQISYTPAANFNGTETFTYTISDGNGGTDTATVTVNVTPVNDAPVAQSQSVSTSEDTAVNGTVTATDVDGPSLSFVLVSGPSHGSLALNGGTGAFTYTPSANYNGPDSFTFRASDSGLTSNTATVSITVTPVNDAPVASLFQYGTGENTPLNETLRASDVEGDALTYQIVSPPAQGTLTITNSSTGAFLYTPPLNFNGTVNFTFKVNDGTADSNIQISFITVHPVNDAPVAQSQSIATSEDTAVNGTVTATDVDGPSLSFVLVSGPAHGTLVLNGGTGAFTYTPSANYNGADSFTFRASDGSLTSNTATVSITVTPVNDAPVANDDTATVAEDSGLTFLNPLGNDTDVDLESLTLTAVGTPNHGGTAVINGGKIAYTPAANFNGTESFTYTISDGSGGTDTATFIVTVTPVNDAPTANDDVLPVAEDSAATLVNVLDNDSIAPDSGETLTITAVTQPTNGTVTVTTATSGVVRYTPALNFNGTDSFTYTISDGNGGTDTATVTVTVTPVNDAPVAQSQSIATSEDTAVNGTVTGTDVDGPSLSFVLVSGPAHGTLVLNGGTGAFTYTPNANYNGPDSFTFRASDSGLTSNTATVSITVTPVNDAPVANDDAAATSEDTPAVINVLGNDTDVDGDSLTITAVGTPNNGGTAAIVSGQIRYTPASNFNGTETFTYTVSDGKGGTDTATVSVTVRPVNDAPDAVNDAATVAEDSGPTAFAVLGNDTDVDGDSLTITAVGMPNKGGTATIVSGQIRYTPAPNFNGTETISYTISDGKGGSDTANLIVTVTPVNDAPVAQDGNFIGDEDSPLNIILGGIDVDGDSLTRVIVNGPSHGSLVASATGFTYTPNANYNGPDSFTFKVNDGTVDSDNVATASITVRPVNDAPTLDAATFTIAENSPNGTAVGTVTGHDVEGDALSYSIIGGNTGGAFAIDPATGAITVANAAALNFEATPVFNLTVQVRDGAGAGTATIRINLTDVPEEREVAIDVKPGDGQNRINSKSNGKLEVAILSTADFDVQLIDIDSLRFGLTGTEDSISQHPKQGPRFHYEDVNGDGRLDLVVRFETELTGLRPNSTKAILNGSLLDGTSFTAEDDVSMK